MVKSYIALAVGVASFFGGIAAAQTSSFARFDRDKSGTVTAGEISEQGDAEIVAAMDANKDGAVTADEWQTRGRGSSYIDKGGVDEHGMARRWLEFKIVYFEFNDGVVSTSSHEGQAPLGINATAVQVVAMRQYLDARFLEPKGSFAQVVASY